MGGWDKQPRQGGDGYEGHVLENGEFEEYYKAQVEFGLGHACHVQVFSAVTAPDPGEHHMAGTGMKAP